MLGLVWRREQPPSRRRLRAPTAHVPSQPQPSWVGGKRLPRSPWAWGSCLRTPPPRKGGDAVPRPLCFLCDVLGRAPAPPTTIPGCVLRAQGPRA